MKKLRILICAAFLAAVPAISTAPITGYCLSTEARSAYLMDYDSKTVVYAENETKRLPIASMTKIMLLNLVFDSVDKGDLSVDEKITVSKTASGMGGSQVFLQADKEYVAKDLVKSVIIASANDASVALAERLYGSESACVDVMNQTANSWGLENTLFSNCTGLPKPTQYSCAKDVAMMLSHLITHKEYFEYSNIWLDELTHPDGQKTTLTNTNKLVKYYAGCDGGKTGFTSDAGYCLAATAKKGTMRMICVCIGEQDSKQRFADVSALFDHAFDNYSQKIIVDKEFGVKESVKVARGKTKNVYVEPTENVYAFVKKNEDANFGVKYEFDENVCAPVKKGDGLGEVIVFKDGVEFRRVELVATDDVERETYGDAVRRVGADW